MGNPQKEQGYTAVANELLEAIIKVKMTDECRRVFLSILRMTYGYNRKTAPISHSYFEKMTYIHRRRVFRAILWLKNANMITTIAGDDRQIVTYSIQKNYALWSIVSPVMLSSKTARPIIAGDAQTIIAGDAHKSNKAIQKQGNSFPQVQEKLLITQNGGTMDFPISDLKIEIENLRKTGMRDAKIIEHFQTREIPQKSIDLAFDSVANEEVENIPYQPEPESSIEKAREEVNEEWT